MEATREWLGMDVDQFQQALEDGFIIAAFVVVATVIIVAVVKIRNYQVNRPAKPQPAPKERPAPKGKSPASAAMDKAREKLQEQAAKTKEEREEQITRARNKSVQVFRFGAPVLLIAVNIGLGWSNLVEFAHQSAGIPSTAANFIVVFFSLSMIWAGTERYLSSHDGKGAAKYTALLWALLAGESTVQFFHGTIYAENVTFLGAVFLAGLSPVAGLTFEFALSRNRQEAKKNTNARNNREIPDSYRCNPLLYARLARTRANNPGWNIEQIVTHVRTQQVAADALRLYRILNYKWALTRRLAGESEALDRLRRSLVALNPFGTPHPDPRMAMVNQMLLIHRAEQIALAAGDGVDILTALGVPQDQARKQLGLPEVDTPAHGVHHALPGVSTLPPSNTPQGVHPALPEGVQFTSAEGVHSGVEDDMDKSLRELLDGVDSGHFDGVHSGDAGVSTPDSEGVHSADAGVSTPDSEGVQSDAPGVSSSKRDGVSTRASRKVSTKPKKKVSTKAKKDTPKKKELTQEEKIQAAYDLVVSHRKEGKSDPSGRKIAAELNCSPTIGSRCLKAAQEKATRDGYIKHD